MKVLHRWFSIALILCLLFAVPAMAKSDNANSDKTPPGQVKPTTPVPTPEPTTAPTAEETPAATPEPTTTAVAADAAGDEPTSVPTENGTGTEGTSGEEGVEGVNPLLVLLPAAALLAAGAVIVTRRRPRAGAAVGGGEEVVRSGVDADDEESGGRGDGAGAASVRTVVQRSPEAAPAPAAATEMTGFPAALAPKYRGVTYLGQGGIARVYRAERVSDGAVVAVKCPLVPDEETGTHFMREIRFWERLHHPNILAIHAANILPVPYVEMEYADHSLKDCLLPLPPEEAVRVIRGVAAGLAFAHDNGVIHRDIKLENILCAADGTPKITDWGLGSVTDGGHRTRVGGFSPGYAAPEQLRPSVHGAEDARTDLYQLGVLFFELLTGTLPFPGEGMGEVTLAILGEPAPVPSAAGAPTDAYDAVVLRCLAKEKEGRFASVADFCSALQEATDDGGHPTGG
ncbi:hypothetical protein AZH53_10190 [Methanomicrobiaceae archaeon CYW5]|nr:hypothetical protein [Methanovulcanius yangii]